MLWCVLASIALHALVFLAFSQRDAPAPRSKALLVLTATLAPVAAAPSEPPAQARPQPHMVLPPAPTPVPPKPVVTPVPAPQKTPANAVRTAPSDALPAAPAAPGTAVASAPPSTPGQIRSAPPASPGATSEAAARSGSEADAGTLEQYRLALIVATRRYKRYPAIAMEKGWQGKVEVHMVIGANGMLASASVKTSSGHDILDNQAVDMLKKGKTTVQVPTSLRGREFSVDVPVIFNLDNPNS